MATQTPQPTGSREKLLCATIELIASRGYDNTGINEILDKAGVTKSNFYYHFDSKEELCLEALECLIQHAHEEIINKVFLSTQGTPRERFESFITNCAQRLEEDCCNRGCPMVNLATETSDFYPPFREKLDAFFCTYTTAIEKWYREGVDAGEFRSDLDATMIAQFILSNINGTMVMTKTLKNPDVIRNNGKAIMTLISA